MKGLEEMLVQSQEIIKYQEKSMKFLYMHPMVYITDKTIIQVFDKFDVNNDGLLNTVQVIEAFKDYEIDIKLSDLEVMLPLFEDQIIKKIYVNPNTFTRLLYAFHYEAFHSDCRLFDKVFIALDNKNINQLALKQIFQLLEFCGIVATDEQKTKLRDYLGDNLFISKDKLEEILELVI